MKNIAVKNLSLLNVGAEKELLRKLQFAQKLKQALSISIGSTFVGALCSMGVADSALLASVTSRCLVG